MRKVTIEELAKIASAEREEVWNEAQRVGREPKIYLHWTAGGYDTCFDDYHINIKGDGSIWLTGDLAEVKSHTWKRNTGSIGITLCCAFEGNTYCLGVCPPTPAQIEAMAQCIAVVAEGLWLTIDKQHVLTHGEAAANEDGMNTHPAYACWHDEMHDGDVRWDLEFLGTDESPRYNPSATDGSRGGDVLRGKANWYAQQHKEI